MREEEMARNVIYFGGGPDNGNLADIVNLPYTDVIVCFEVVDGNLNVYGNGAAFDDNLQSNIRALQNAGKKVLVSFGGDPTTFPSSDWQRCAQSLFTFNPDGQSVIVNNIVAFLAEYGFDGIDIDYEDDDGFTRKAGYDGVQFLIGLTIGISRWLPNYRKIITHAPQSPYWYPDGGYGPNGGPGAPYQTIWSKVGSLITWINNQFYSNPAYDSTAARKVQSYHDIANITGSQKLLMGVLLSGGEGAETLDDMVQNVIPPLLSSYGPQFGGVMGWQFAFDQGGSWANGLWQALVAGSPAPVPQPAPPPTLDPEIVYLCNCYLSDGQKSSEMNYYPKTSLSQHGERPAATAVVATDGTVTWEGHPVVGTFPDGNHFTSNITDHNGPVGAVKGSGFNDYHQFTCRQDSGRLLYSDGNKSCYSIYYCQ
jgi:chitinase